MKLFKLDVPTSEFEFCDYDDISEYNLNDLSKSNAQAVFYWYVCDIVYAQGEGQALLLKDNAWYLYDCSHCSCYGPFEDIDTELIKSTPMQLNEIESRCSKEHWEKNVKALVDFAIRKGYK